MSMPNIPNIEPKITLQRDDAINLLLTSIALEEIGLSHIINAEAEKIQSVLGTLEGQKPNNPSTEDLIKIDNLVSKQLRNVIKKEMLLQFKLEDVLEISPETTS